MVSGRRRRDRGSDQSQSAPCAVRGDRSRIVSSHRGHLRAIPPSARDRGATATPGGGAARHGGAQRRHRDRGGHGGAEPGHPAVPRRAGARGILGGGTSRPSRRARRGRGGRPSSSPGTRAARPSTSISPISSCRSSPSRAGSPTSPVRAFTILIAIILGFPAPLLPLQILWVNIVTGGPAPSPFACDFDPFHVPRVQARPSELRRWLDELDRGPLGRFVSDGDADAVTIPAGARGELRRTLGPGIASSKRIGRARTTANDVASPPQRGAFPCPCRRARRKMVAQPVFPERQCRCILVRPSTGRKCCQILIGTEEWSR